jgi:outer membrane protein TolC
MTAINAPEPGLSTPGENRTDLALEICTPWSCQLPAAFDGRMRRGVIFDAGALAAQVEQQDAVAAQALLEYEQTVRNAVSEVEQKLSAVALGRQVADALTDQAKADRETLAIATERYRRGLTTFLDVADAERGVFASELALQQKQGQVALDSISLYKAVGGSWTAPDGTVPALPVVAN